MVYRRGRDGVHLAVHGGFAEVTPELVILLAETAERARQRAEQRMTGRDPDGAESEIDDDDAAAAYQRALTRLVVAIGGG